MPVVIITQGQLSQVAVPPQLANYLSSSHWNVIRSGVSNAINSAMSASCAAEWGICCFFLFPCVFLCHPCIYRSLLETQLQTEVGRINGVLFRNERVVSVIADSIAINTDLLLPLNSTTIIHQHVVYNTVPGTSGMVSPVMMQASPPPPVASSQPVMVTAVPINESQPVSYNEKTTTVSNPAYQNTVYAAPVPQQQLQQNVVTNLPRTMNVTLPQGVQPGQVLVVATPNGSMVQLTVQPHHRPGQTVLVSY